uniref:Uncharacterized protein n=1 Tax=viral metagenome TaxID=1070528 RepID=A0A6M3IYU0_9ZZZZ
MGNMFSDSVKKELNERIVKAKQVYDKDQGLCEMMLSNQDPELLDLLSLAPTPGVCLDEQALIAHLQAHPEQKLFEDTTGKIFQCSLTPDGVHVQGALDNFSVKYSQVKPSMESEPALFHQTGIYLTPPHGELIAKGKKKAIIKSFQLKSHLNEPLYLLSGKLCYGIIKIKDGRKISVKELQKSFESHQVSEGERKQWWKDYKSLFFYPVEVIRIFSPPKPYEYQKGPQVFVKDVKFTEKDEPTRQEVKEEEKEKGNWYLVQQPKGKDFRYVAQCHFRGQSVHTDLRLEANSHLVGWTLNTPSLTAEGLKGPQAKYAESKYNRFLFPRDPSQTKDFQILVEQKLKQPKEWLKVEGKIPPGGIGATKYKEAEFKIISTGVARWGASKTDFNEIFLKPDKKWNQTKIAGRWVIVFIPRPTEYERAGEGKMMWAMFKPDDQRPYVTTHNLEKETEKAEKDGIEMLWQHPDGSISKKIP